MSDFLHQGWGLFVAVLTVVGLALCLVLLLIASRRQVMADDNSTGHVWDEDLRELNNPLPRWWMWLFVITVVFAAVYLTFYPGLGARQGSLGWSSEAQLQKEQDTARAAMDKVYAAFRDQPIEQLSQDPKAQEIGQRLFLNQCAQCHGSDARGSKGFPNLADKDWLGDGTPAYIQKTIVEGRTGQMPAMAAAVGSADDVRNVANYVLSLSGSAHNNIAAQLGKDKYTACAGCHGANGKGNAALGAPNLTDSTWLHGWGEAAVAQTIAQGRTNVMPAQGRLLTPDQVRVLTAYVWGLSNSPTASTVAQQTARAGEAPAPR